MFDASTRISSGIEGLDAVLHGGFPEGGMYLVEGGPGTGKTTLGLHFLLRGAEQGRRCLFVSLAQSADTLEEIARSHEWSLAPIEVRAITPAAVLGEPQDAQDVFVPDALEMLDLVERLKDLTEGEHAQLVVFDSLSLIQILASNPQTYRRQLISLTEHLRRNNVTALLTLARSEFDVTDAATVCDGVVRLTSVVSPYRGQQFRINVEKLRGCKFEAGDHDYHIVTGGLRVFPRLMPTLDQEVVPRERFESGIAELDDLVGGGLAAGTSALVIGPSGSGKTTIATQYLHAATANGAPAEIFLFEEVRETFLRRARDLGMDLRPAIDDGILGVTQIEGTLVSPGEFSVMVRRAIDGGAKVIVIDSLTGYFRTMPDEDVLLPQVRELIRYMNRHEVMSILTMAQKGLVGQEVQSPLDVSESADAVLLLRYFESQGNVHKAISVIKKRYGRHATDIREMTVATGEGLRVGGATHGFSGILSGIPTFVGEASALMNREKGDS